MEPEVFLSTVTDARVTRRTLIVGAIAGLVSSRVLASSPRVVPRSGFTLLSDAEYRRIQAEFARTPVQSASPGARAAPIVVQGAPQIRIVKPASMRVVAPLDLDVRFVAASGAHIDPATLHLDYRTAFGWMDITERLRPHANVDPNGMHAPGAKIPVGKHRIRITIADDLRRKGQKDIEFEILAPT